MSDVDLLVIHASELLTMVGPDGETAGPRRGEALAHLGTIADGAVAVKDGKVVATGTTRDLLGAYAAEQVLDARDRVVMPGLVDPHTHPVYAGSRAWELDYKIKGRTYQEITRAGGGIPYTVEKTRAASADELVAGTEERLLEGLHHGTTTMECKSGYGLSHDSELAQLAAIDEATRSTASRTYKTFLGAHERPPERKDDIAGYLDEMARETLPALAKLGAATFVDAFVETGVYTPDDVRPMLAAARSLGFGLRLHVDEFTDINGAAFAVEMGARSADHLLCVNDDGIEALAGSDTVATLLPLVPFSLRKPVYAPARRMIDAGCVIALATDHNPNVPCLNMQTVIDHAVYLMGLRPAEALVAATVNAGWSLDKGAGLGVLAPGHPADLLVTTAPDHVTFAYRYGVDRVRHVVAGGRVVR